MSKFLAVGGGSRRFINLDYVKEILDGGQWGNMGSTTAIVWDNGDRERLFISFDETTQQLHRHDLLRG